MGRRLVPYILLGQCFHHEHRRGNDLTRRLLPLKAGNIAHRQFGSAYVLNGDLLEEYFTGVVSYIFSHLKELDRILKVWKKMSQLAKRETVAEIKKVLPGQLPV
ncbi:hypothetical protein HELRODRAFT_189121 [Helobdella robusta]|uniref:Uncharacterized protein n=1 Tax=Helobdella robusta TaxID=6412 RepID=T1FQP3_HELRO|nr:hypothetical protein HELRODRAFT_189121 [Helobdella robusta]ESN96138.1 hypothetical protein HELRODRAFT_189121 [Helobdella robusta]